MSHIFGLDVDFNYNETLKQRLENQLTFPTLTASEAGFVFYHTANQSFYGWDGSAWIDLGAGGGGGNYVTLDTVQTITAGKTFSASNTFSGFLNTFNRVSLSNLTTPILFLSEFQDPNLPNNTSSRQGMIYQRDLQYYFAKPLGATQHTGDPELIEAAILELTNLTAPRTYTFPDASGTLALEGSFLTTGINVINGTFQIKDSGSNQGFFFNSTTNETYMQGGSVGNEVQISLDDNLATIDNITIAKGYRLEGNAHAVTGTLEDGIIHSDTFGFMFRDGASQPFSFLGQGLTGVRTLTIPNASGTIALTSDLSDFVDKTSTELIGGLKSFSSAIHAQAGRIIFNDDASTVGYASGGSMGYLGSSQYYFFQDHVNVNEAAGILDFDDLTTDRIFTWPNKAGTVAMVDDVPSVGVVGYDTTTFTNVGTGTETAGTITAATDQSTANGDVYRIRAAGRMTGAGTKTISLKIDLDSGSQGLNTSNFISVTTNGTWNVDVILIRDGATSFNANSVATFYTTTGPNSRVVPGNHSSTGAITWSGLAANFTVDIASTVASTLTLDTFSVEFIPAL